MVDGGGGPEVRDGITAVCAIGLHKSQRQPGEMDPQMKAHQQRHHHLENDKQKIANKEKMT